MSEPQGKLRIDKWLWHARFFKTRSLAAKVVAAGHCRVNGNHVGKPSFTLSVQDVVTFPQGNEVRVARVLALGVRRGPAPEARLLYENLTPPRIREPDAPAAPAYDKGGRPTKRDRRKMDESRLQQLE